MPFSKVVLIIVTLIILDYAQVAANEDLELSESKGKKFPRHIQPNVRTNTQRRRLFLRNGAARGRSDSSENGGEENDPPGYVIISYGGRIGKKDNGQRYSNKYGSDYSVEYVGNLYGYEDAHGYGNGYNSGHSGHSGHSSGYGGVTSSHQGTSTGGGSDEDDKFKGNTQFTSDVSVMNGDTGSDETKDSGGSIDDPMVTGEDAGTIKDSKGNADPVGEATPPAGGSTATDETVAINGPTTDDASAVGGDATGIEASKGKDEVMVDSVITGGDATVSMDGTEAIGGETVGGEGSKGMEAMDEMTIPVDGEVPGTVIATGTVETMDELMALLDGIGGSEGSTSPIKSMDDLMAIIGEAEGVEGLGDITGLTDHTAGIDGSIANTGSIGSPVDSFTTGAEVNDEDSHSGIKAGSLEEDTYSSSIEDEYTVTFDFVTEDEAVELGAFTKSAAEQNPYSPANDDDFSISFLTADTAKASASGTEVASEIATIEKGNSKIMSEPAEMIKAEALTTTEETGKMVAKPAEMMNVGGKESTSMLDTESAPSPGSEKSISPIVVPEINANSLRRMGRNGHDSRRPVNYRNGDGRLIVAGKVNHPGNRVRPQSRAISSLPIENQKHRNLAGNGEKVHSTGGKIGPATVRNVPMNKPMKLVRPNGGTSGNGASKFRSIGEGTSAIRGMKENGPMGSKSVREIQSGPGKIKLMSGNVDMVNKDRGTGSTKSVSVAPITEQSKNGPSSNPSGNTGSGKKRFLSMGKGRNTSGNSGKLESGSASIKSAKTQSGNEEKVKKGNGDKMSGHGGKGSTRPARPARPAQLMSPPPSKEMMRPNPMKGDTASENQEKGEVTSEKPAGKGSKATKNSVKDKRQISTSSSPSSSEKGKKGSEKGSGKETDTSESTVKTSSGGGEKGEKVNGDEGKQNGGFVRNAPLNIVRYLRKGIGRYL